MLTIILLLALLVVFDIAAMYWGHDSSDGPESEEWERRQQISWFEGYSGKHSFPTVSSLRGAAGSLSQPLSWQEMRQIACEDRDYL